MVTTEKRLNKNTSFFSKYITYSNFLILTFFILSFIGILNHELWRDEAQAWLIAKDSSSLIDLYQNIKYEGHPGLWHLCLLLISRFTHNPFAMQLFHIIISTATVYIFVKSSPFNILQKTFFIFGYFTLFEYNLISRNYNLVFLLVFAFCYLFTRKNRNYITLFLTLALLANTNFYGFIICLCLGATTIIDTVRIHRIPQYRLNRKQIKNLTVGLVILLLGVSLSILQILPAAIQDTASDIQQNVGQQATVSRFDFIIMMLRRLGYALRAIWYSYIPIPNFFEYHFWSKNIVIISKPLILFASFMSLILITFSVLIFIEKPIALFLYLSGTFGIVLFTWLKFQGTLRHHGNVFIVFLASIWISHFFRKAYDIPKPFQKITYFCKKYQKAVITIILLVQMLSGLYAYSMDLVYPFTKSKAAAEFIQKQGLDNNLILAEKDTIVSPISAYIDKKIYYLQYNKFGSFFNNYHRKFIKSESELIDKVNVAIKDSSEKNVLILSEPLEMRTDNLEITQIGEFKKGIIGEEKYYIYLVEKNN